MCCWILPDSGHNSATGSKSHLKIKFKTQPYIIIALLSLFALGCQQFEADEKYQRPDWLAGKVYTQIKGQPDLSTFAHCVELAGYDTILDVSGSYTVFAPNNEAFSEYFQGHPVYNAVEDIPVNELIRIVKYHIVQNPWSKIQLRSLDIGGWIDTLALDNNEPKGFKRETLLMDKNRDYGIGAGRGGVAIIVDTLESNWHRKVATDSRKYAPIFFKEYLDIYNLTGSDYEFYFDRTIQNAEDMFFAGGKIIGDEIFAENGFVYNIDRVIEPLPSGYQILNSTDRGYSYKDFLELLHLYPEFEYDREKTLDQPGAELGYEVDSLFNLTFPALTFDFNNEITEAPAVGSGQPTNGSIRYHHGMLAPTDEAFASFIQEYLEQGDGIPWGSLYDTPAHIKRMIANSYMSVFPVYRTDYENGFLNGELDIVRLDQADIVDKQYGSNCTFIGLGNAIVPRAFKAVTGPVYLQKGYSYVMYAIEESGLLSALKRENEDYMFFVESDVNCFTDSSLMYNLFDDTFVLFQLSEGSAAREIPLGTNDLRTLLLNHIGTRSPRGIARKEFIKNRAGNYIVVDNETGEIRGTSPSTMGYQGSEVVIDYPELLSTETDNGSTYDIQNWFSFGAPSLYTIISQQYPAFHSLLQKAGLSRELYYDYTFISENELYTVFAPKDSVLNSIQADLDTMTIPELTKFCLMHVIQGSLIFTDGSQAPGYYETLRVDESSTEFITLYSKVYIEPGTDVIRFTDNSGGTYLSLNESSLANKVAGISVGSGQEVFPNTITNAIVHSVDRAFIYELMDTR